MAEISSILRQQAVSEIKNTLADSVREVRGTNDVQGSLRADDELILEQQAENLLKERLREIQAMHDRLEKNISRADANHKDPLLIGNRKDMRHLLRMAPGVTKETSKAIVIALFGLDPSD